MDGDAGGLEEKEEEDEEEDVGSAARLLSPFCLSSAVVIELAVLPSCLSIWLVNKRAAVWHSRNALIAAEVARNLASPEFAALFIGHGNIFASTFASRCVVRLRAREDPELQAECGRKLTLIN